MLLARTGAGGCCKVAHKYSGSCAPSRWFPPAFKHESECGPHGLTHAISRTSPMRTASGYQSPAVPYHTPVRVRLQPRILILSSGTRNILPTRKEALFLAHIRRRLSGCGQTDAFDFCEARAKYRVGEVSREAEPAWAFSCAALGGFRVTGLAENRRLEWRATFDEGRRKTECQMRASKYPIRPSSQNGDATFQRRNAARQAAVVRGSRR